MGQPVVFASAYGAPNAFTDVGTVDIVAGAGTVYGVFVLATPTGAIAGASFTSATYGGVAMTPCAELTSTTNASFKTRAFYLSGASMPTGTVTASATLSGASGGTHIGVLAVLVRDPDGAVPTFRNFASSSLGSVSQSLSVVTAGSSSIALILETVGTTLSAASTISSPGVSIGYFPSSYSAEALYFPGVAGTISATWTVQNSSTRQNHGIEVYGSATADTTPPTLTGTVTVSAITTTTATLTWPAGADNVAVVSYEWSLDGATWTNVGNVLTIGLTGLTAGTAYTARVRDKDAAGNVSTPAITGAFTTAAAGDTTAPVLTGSITASAVTSTTYTLTGSAATDNVAVTGYEYSVNGGSTYTANGTALTVNVTGRTPGATDSVAWRAFDAAGNRSAALTTTVTLAAAAATTILFSGPSSGVAGAASAVFTISANGTVSGSHVVTMGDTSGGGTWSPTTVTLTSGAPSATATYTPVSAGAKTLTAVDAGGYTAPSSLTYTASSSTVTFTSDILRDEFGQILASLAMSYYRLYNVSTGALVVSKTGLSTDSLGKVSFSDAALTAATPYKSDWLSAAGHYRMPTRAAV